MESIFEYQFRLILIGDSMVGKSSLLKYFTDGQAADIHCDPTVGVDFFARLMEVEPGVRVKLQLWDTAGQERFRSITRSYYRNSVGAMLVFDMCNRNSFLHLEEWLEEARLHIEPQQAVFLVVGHKLDRESERQVSHREAKAFAEEQGLEYIETSAKNGQNIEEAFMYMGRRIYNALQRGDIKPRDGWDGVKVGCLRPPASFHLEESDEIEPKKSKCCR